MVARFAGASLGLLAFATTLVAGLSVGNPPTVILSRSIFALFTFCVIGLLLGKAAQSVVTEYERTKTAEIERRHCDYPAEAVSGSSREQSERAAVP